MEHPEGLFLLNQPAMHLSMEGCLQEIKQPKGVALQSLCEPAEGKKLIIWNGSLTTSLDAAEELFYSGAPHREQLPDFHRVITCRRTKQTMDGEVPQLVPPNAEQGDGFGRGNPFLAAESVDI